MANPREKQINLELILLKMELNSFYGFGKSEIIRCEKIFDRVIELRRELKKIKENLVD